MHLDPARLLQRQRLELHIERRHGVGRLRVVIEPTTPCARMRIGVCDIWLEIEHRRAIQHVGIADVQEEPVHALQAYH